MDVCLLWEDGVLFCGPRVGHGGWIMGLRGEGCSSGEGRVGRRSCLSGGSSQQPCCLTSAVLPWASPVLWGHPVNALSSWLFLQLWYHLWFCGKPPPQDADRKHSETGRQQFQRLENSPEWNSIGKNHSRYSPWCFVFGAFQSSCLWLKLHLDLVETHWINVDRCYLLIL